MHDLNGDAIDKSYPRLFFPESRQFAGPDVIDSCSSMPSLSSTTSPNTITNCLPRLNIFKDTVRRPDNNNTV